MKTQFKSFPIMSMLALSLISLKTYSMDEVICQKTSQLAQKSLSSTISLEAQKYLTDVGHKTLNEILNDGHDVSKSGLYDKFTAEFPKLMESSKYSAISEYSPTNFIRGWFASVDNEYIIQRKNHLMTLVSLSWAFVDIAKSQNDFFERGSFTVIDPYHKVAKFIKDYVCLVTNRSDPENQPFVLEQSNFAYRRDPQLHGSSHHKGHCPDSQFGIDVRFEPTESVLKLLPFDYTHMLFAILDIGKQEEPLLFFKLEPLGMGSSGAIVLHSANFLHSQSNVESAARREKDIDEKIMSAFKNLIPETQNIQEYKTIRSMVLEALRLRDLNDPNKTHNNLKESGINTDIGSFHALKIENVKDLYNKAQSFVSFVDTLYPNGNNHLRVGNEVIINLGSLRQ